MTTTDNDLNPVLAKASNEDLAPLVEWVTGETEAPLPKMWWWLWERPTEKFFRLKNFWSNKLTASDEYAKHHPNHRKYSHIIAQEIRAFGGNTVANFFREAGCPPYQKVVAGVAKKLRLKVSKGDSVEVMEEKILAKGLQDILGQMWDKNEDGLCEKSLTKMSTEDLLAFIEKAKKYHTGIRGVTKAEAAKEALGFVFIGGRWKFRISGFKPYKAIPIIAKKVVRLFSDRGPGFETNYRLTKAAKIITGPVFWALLGAWVAMEIASPSYRTTIRCVIYVAILRKKQELAKEKGTNN